MSSDAPTQAEDSQIEWREQVGIRVMFAMKCAHSGDERGDKAVCVTCFETTQTIGVLIEQIAGRAWDQGALAERREWELTGDLSTPDEDRQPSRNPYRALPPLNRTDKPATAAKAADLQVCVPRADCADPHPLRHHCMRGHGGASAGICPLDYCDQRGANQ